MPFFETIADGGKGRLEVWDIIPFLCQPFLEFANVKCNISFSPAFFSITSDRYGMSQKSAAEK